MPAGRKPGARVLGATAKKVIVYLREHQDDESELPSTRKIADGCGLSMDQAKNALLRLLKTDRVMHCVTITGSRWRLVLEDDYRLAEDH